MTRIAKPKRWLRYLPLLLIPLVIPVMLGFVFVIVPIVWLFSPFHGPPHRAGTQTVTVYYAPLENAAVKRYSECHVVYLSQFNGSKMVKTPAWALRGVDTPFVQAVMKQESDGWAGAVSRAGAFGLMQVTLGKFQRDMAIGKSPMDPRTNIMRGVQYLDLIFSEFHGNLPLVAAAYNAGPGRMQQWISEYHTTNWSVISSHAAVQAFARGQTFNYVSNVMVYYAQFSPGYTPGQTCGPLPRASTAPRGSGSGG